MIGWLLKKVSWKTFAAGAATVIVGGTVLRPALVSTVRAGIGASSAAADMWQQAVAEAGQIKAEAAKPPVAAAADPAQSARVDELLVELRSLRKELDAVKSKVKIA
jgi:hypothetical protein